MAFPKAHRSELGQRIEERFTELGFANARVFARHAGLNYDTLRSLMNGKVKEGRADTLECVARALKWSVDVLQGRPRVLAEVPGTSEFVVPVPDEESNDEAFGEVTRRVAAMLADAHLGTDHGTIGAIARRVWRDAHSLPRGMSFADRIQLSMDEALNRELHRRAAWLEGKH